MDDTLASQLRELVTSRLANEEGIFAGTSSGANRVAANRIARRSVPEAAVATIMVDSGLRCLGTDVFRPFPNSRGAGVCINLERVSGESPDKASLGDRRRSSAAQESQYAIKNRE